ncbi:hypothetical protein VC83_00974 [Pseudogymnoascus destructans]|uniref:S-adenosylmethionine transporter n=2 Tax=Pseudogymnoascus destructans TaxID=655981 RepID=L8FLH9_PSED2|nr:uncharacterized protein VC83_00974 [Pseudogymnoascus destructans]ELR01745.1 hypothetical protein GMDG_00121 [Pseudogymnoascus destructans 20631-21]OAF62214.1 hypothetical protein VC83_00974 [Pseudogymnoascus destructans]
MSNNTNVEVLIAGGIAAFTIDLLAYPLDTLKTRFQSKDYKRIYYDPAKNAVNKAVLFRGLYQGVGSVILVTLPSSGIFFTTYEAVKSGCIKINPTQSGSQHPLVPLPIVHSVASSVAELASCLILTPAEVIKQNAQMVRRPAGSHHSSFKQSPTYQVLQHFKKPTQLLRGYTSLAARNLPFTAMQFPMYEHLKRTINSSRQKKGKATGSISELAAVTAVSASAAGSVASFITTPLDVVKTRVMLSAMDKRSDNSSTKPAGSVSPGKGSAPARASRGVNIDVARRVLSESGVKGLFRGASLRSAWSALASGLYLGVYESMRMWLGERRVGTDV